MIKSKKSIYILISTFILILISSFIFSSSNNLLKNSFYDLKIKLCGDLRSDKNNIYYPKYGVA